MPYSYNGSIKNFWPDDEEHVFYLESSSNYSLIQILDRVKDKWPDANLSDITIESESIHTNCLTYDSYVSSDHTDFIVITLNK